MEPPAGKSKLLLIALSGILLSVAAAAAPQPDMNLEDGTVWLNNDEANLEASPTCTNATKGYVSLEERDVNLTEEINSTLTTSDFRDNKGSPYSAGSYTINLTCSDGENSSSVEADLDLKALDFAITSGGKGDFGEKMGESRYSSPFSFKIKESSNVQVKVEDLSISSSENHVEVNEWSLESGEIEPFIQKGYDPSDREIELEFVYDDGEESINLVHQASVEIYPWKTSLNGESMGVRIFYDKLLEGFQYDVGVDYADFEEALQKENFRVTVTKAGEEEPFRDYEARKWFKVVEDDRNRYVIRLNTRPELPKGAYTFKTFIKRDGRTAPIDTVRVTNALKFSGVVRDSNGGPVKTQMLLKRQSGSNVPISTGSDGTYSATIEKTDFDSVELMFFDRGLSAPDTNFQLQDVELGENPNLGFSSEAIRYQYWENPVSDVEGLQEVNMMAGKFSHDIRGGAEAFMKFDPQSVNPENLKVYECTSWNFQGRKCMSSWGAMQSNDVSIDYATWRVNIQNLDLHEIPEEVTGGSNKTILMNAYVVGTSSELGLEGDVPITVSSERLAANEQLSVSGTVVDGEGDTVENVDVDVELRKDGEAFRTLEASSGPNGGFEASGKAPSEDGRYSIEVSVSKDLYQSYSVESSKTLEVFYERGVEISSAGTPDLRLGEPTTLEFSLSNTGQRPVKDVSISVSGLEDEYYEKVRVPEELESGATNDVRVRISLPSDFCPAPCANPPVIDIEAVGNSAGEELSAQTTIYTSINRDTSENATSREPDQEQEQTPQTSETSSTDNNSTKGSLDRIGSMTGNFLKRQSSVNIALGLIMVFTMILALAVRKKKDDDSRSRASGRARPVSTDGSRVNKPEVAAAEEESEVQEDSGDEENSSPGEDGEQVEKDEDDEGGEEESFVCDECGEEFDTEEALDMHREINGEH